MRDKYLCCCAECTRLGRIRPADEVDHILALAHGGTDSMSNLRAINHVCHLAKTQVESRAARLGR